MSSQSSRPNGPANLGQNVPAKYRCSLGGEWKPLQGFSKRQQKILQDKFKNRSRIDPANTGMICRVHSGEPLKEILCEGPCNEVRVLDDFAKNNRTNGVYICKHCQHWTNVQEPGYAPWAAPKNKLDPLEEMDDFEGRMATEPSEIFDFHTGNDKAITIAYGGTSRTGSDVAGRSLRIEDNTRRVIAPSVSVSSHSTAPMRRAASSVVSDDTITSSLNDLNIGNNKSQAQVKTRAQATEKKIPYNAWDSTGQKHTRNKTPSVVSGSLASVVSQYQKPLETRSSNEVQGEKCGEQSDPFLKNNPFPSTGRSGFGSAPERQSSRRQLTNKEHQQMQRTLPQRRIIMPYQDDDGVDEESD
ncbi:hypothetical protein CkaCkLH20_04934 [Colletotrichum karsti]|uniref:Stc1 domain-containing protein n=1 Tax=Colletotrichum karsti TaxID=1095194 RepID=A0A9P6LIY7_9PEZI|nr:uncharacterized protein CkaCkLH20_04934 [Colletotrichum karsti]KAF9877799.1 hypothetical protein CkaCkLH20_04934 [Colletotrichum karsti]